MRERDRESERERERGVKREVKICKGRESERVRERERDSIEFLELNNRTRLDTDGCNESETIKLRKSSVRT